MSVENRLAKESSPYLRQHRHNPVDWYPWGEEALARARAEDKPILLSVGYSACHWCHVMERECFEDEAIAALMNRLFVNVKVDREERPDLDNIYQTAVQLLRQSGGWPLTAFLTPEGRPFFAGTYFPPTPRHGLPGFPQLLEQVQHAWTTRRSEVESSSRSIAMSLEKVRDTGGRDAIGDATTVQAAAEALLARIDGVHGGFGNAPKFPSPTSLWTVWRLWARTGEEAARDAVLLTLTRMADGGVYDQLAGGFHRYSTDREWLVPHFEKMLYDNALLVPLYLEAWRTCAVGSGPREAAPDLLRVATETLTWLQREMRSPEGLFYAATDADSEGEEGRYFVWTVRGVHAALADQPDGEVLAEAFCRFYDVTPEGNWEGSAILRRRNSVEHVARGLAIQPATLEARLTRAQELLLAVRARRVPPLRDDKCLVSWNALTALAFVEGWRATGDTRWLDTARTAVDTLLATLVVDGRLLHAVCDGDRRGPGFLDDHAALGLALLHLHEAGGERRHLDAALALAIAIDAWFADPAGGWFQTPSDGETLVHRPKDSHDSAVPCGSGLAAAFFARLAAVTGEDRWEARVEAALCAHAGLMDQNPFATGTLLGVLDGHLAGWEEVVLAGEGPERAAMQRVLGQTPGLDRLVLRADELPAGHPAAGRPSTPTPTAWVCRGRTCSLPVTGAEALRALLTR